MPARRTTAETAAPPRRGHGNPGVLILLGLAMLGFAFLVITLQIQTNIAFINGTQNVDGIFQAQWSIWLQIPKLALGDVVPGPAIKSNEIPGVIIGQGIELAYLALVSGFEIAFHSTKKLGRLLGIVALILAIAICVFNFCADLAYGNVSLMAHWAFAIFCTFVVGFFPTWGLSLIGDGWRRL